MKSSHNNNKVKILDQRWNDKFGLPDGSYSVSDIQILSDIQIYQILFFEYILKKNNKKIDNPSIRIYANKIENRIYI